MRNLFIFITLCTQTAVKCHQHQTDDIYKRLSERIYYDANLMRRQRADDLKEIKGLFNKLNEKIDSIGSNINKRIDSVESEMNEKINSVYSRMTKSDNSENQMQGKLLENIKDQVSMIRIAFKKEKTHVRNLFKRTNLCTERIKTLNDIVTTNKEARVEYDSRLTQHIVHHKDYVESQLKDLEAKQDLVSERLGSAVLKGDKGEPGELGLRGQDGTPGRKGKKGETGFPGPSGKDGLPGATGFQGQKGEKGDRGPRGKSGSYFKRKGDRGDTGPPGLQGLRGQKGDKGDTGLTGPSGQNIRQKGDKGDRGLPGLKSLQGLKGDKGDRGPTGPSGQNISQKGDKGDRGLPGLKGLQGPKGEKGDRGPIYSFSSLRQKGDKGDKGQPGLPGIRENKGATIIQGHKAAAPATSCKFEEPILCGWVNDNDTDVEWRLRMGNTKTARTGPQHDHTFGKAGNGAAQLDIYIKPKSREIDDLTPVFTVNENKGDKWISHTVLVSYVSEPFQVAFVATRGYSFRSDVAIDDVSLYVCPAQISARVEDIDPIPKGES